jgi:branched-chain amino acid transport system substrate-binding protein
VVAGRSSAVFPSIQHRGEGLRRGIILLVTLGVLAAGAAGCETSGRTDVITIGYSGPLSGGGALYGRNALSGIRMAVDEINAAGGIEVGGEFLPVEVVALDDRYLANETATNARRLLQRHGAPVIFVPHSGGILALQGMNTREPPFLLMAYSSEPAIIEAANPLTVMVPTRFDGYVSVFAERAMERFGPRLGLLPTTTTYGRAWTDYMTREWERRGGEVSPNRGVDYNTTTDFTGAVSRVLADRPDVILVGGPSQPTGLVIRAAREQGFEGGFIMMDQSKFEEVLDVVPMAALEGVVGVHPMESYPGPGVPDFVERYHRTFGPDAPLLVSELAQNYQATHMAARAISLAGTADDVEAIRARVDEAARGLEPGHMLLHFSGVSADGYIARDVFAAEVVDGQFVTFPVPTPRR